MGVWGLCPQWGPGAKPLGRRSGGEAPEAERIFVINGSVLSGKFNVYSLFPLIHDKCQGHKNPSPPLHIRDAFQVSWANQLLFKKKGYLKIRDRYQAPGQESGTIEALEAECVSIYQFIFELKIHCISLFLLYPL